MRENAKPGEKFQHKERRDRNANPSLSDAALLPSVFFSSRMSRGEQEVQDEI
jgi:hypothetical protein